jgi:DNA-binding LacI/PurR family transcriptional regulator
MVSLWKNGTEVSWQRWIDLLNFLAGRKIPVIAIDQEGDIVFPERLLRSANFRVLRIGSIRAGEIVAAALLRRRHTRIFYVAPFFKHRWAQDRFAGLRRYCASYGGPAVTVELCALEELGDHQDLAVGLLGLDKKELRLLYRGQYSNEELEEVLARLDRIKKTEVLENMASTPIAKMIRDFTAFLKQLAGQDHDQNAYGTLFNALGHISSNTALRSFLKPFFQNILDKGSPAVWACSDDTDAALALSFLRQSGVRVPDDISLCSFDNSRESFIYQMSSYDFNMQGMAQQALQMMVDVKYLKSRPVISEVDGIFVERGTTRK